MDDKEFVRRASRMTIQKMLPLAARAMPPMNTAEAENLEEAAARCEKEGTIEAAEFASRTFKASVYARRLVRAAEDAIRAVRVAEAAVRPARPPEAAEAAAAAFRALRAVEGAEAAAEYVAEYALRAAECAECAGAAQAPGYAGGYVAESAALFAAITAEASGRATIDGVLSDYAEWIVQILIEMGAPGCQWLDLADKLHTPEPAVSGEDE